MYEVEKQRLMELLTTATGIQRTFNAALSAEADKRAFEAFVEVGYEPVIINGVQTYKKITHPTQLEAESRLGPTWAGKGVGEIAIWKYDLIDPIASLAKGWMDSAPHRAVLMDPKYKHWGPGIFTYLPDGQPERMRRWYGIMWVSINAPEAAVAERFTDVAAGDDFYDDIQWMANKGITLGTGNGSTFSPEQPVTRGQMAAFMHRLYKLLGGTE